MEIYNTPHGHTRHFGPQATSCSRSLKDIQQGHVPSSFSPKKGKAKLQWVDIGHVQIKKHMHGMELTQEQHCRAQPFSEKQKTHPHGLSFHFLLLTWYCPIALILTLNSTTTAHCHLSKHACSLHLRSLQQTLIIHNRATFLLLDGMNTATQRHSASPHREAPRNNGLPQMAKQGLPHSIHGLT